jgi:hypothetical protein
VKLGRVGDGIDGLGARFLREVGRSVELYSRKGCRFDNPNPVLVDILPELPSDPRSWTVRLWPVTPLVCRTFWRLFTLSPDPAELRVCVRCLNGKDVRKWSLEARQGRLQALGRFDCPAVLPSEAFKEGQALLEVAERHELEGVASRRRLAPYRSGECRDWRKRRPRGARRTGSEASFRAGLSAGLPPSCCRPVRTGLP